MSDVVTQRTLDLEWFINFATRDKIFFDPLRSLPTPSILVHAIFVDLVRNAVLSSFDFRLVKFGVPSCRVTRIGVCKQSLAKSLSLEFGHSQLISAGHFFDS